MAEKYFEAVNILLKKEMQNTLDLIEQNKDKVQSLADELLSKNHLTGEEILRVLKTEA